MQLLPTCLESAKGEALTFSNDVNGSLLSSSRDSTWSCTWSPSLRTASMKSRDTFSFNCGMAKKKS